MSRYPSLPFPGIFPLVGALALVGLIVTAFPTSALVAQVVPPPPAAVSSPDRVMLEPFEVISDRGDTYEALNFSSLSGTNRSLDKLPITAEVYNSTLLADLAITDTVNLLTNYATGIVPGEASPASSAASGAADGDRFNLSGFGIRGLNAGMVRRNGFLSANNLGEAFEVDRVEIIRGPQSLLYGTNPAGGVINVVTKKALFGTTFLRPQVQLDSDGTRRYAADANVSKDLRGRPAALRLAAVDSNNRFWRPLIRRKTWGVFGEGAVELFPATKTTLRYEQEERIGRTDAEPRAQTRVSGIPTVVPNNSVLAVLIARNDPGLAQIANGAINWDNVDELFGYSNVTQRRERYKTLTLSSKLASWLQGQVIASRESVVLDRISPGGATALTAPRTGSNPLNAWAVAYSPSAAHNAGRLEGLRALLTADFALTRLAKNNFVVGAERTRSTDGYNFTYSFDQVDAAGNFVTNAAQANTANGGRNAMPIQWVDITTNLHGPITLDQTRYTLNNLTYVRHDQKVANPAFIGPGNPLGFNGGPGGATIVDQSGEGAFAALFTTWFGGKLETMLGGRYDTLFVNNVNTGSTVDARGTTGNAGFVWNVTKPLAVYGGLSSNFRPGSTNGSAGPDGKLLPNGRGEGWEGGLKLNLLEGRLSGSLAYYSTSSVNEAQAISTTARSAVDPTGINGAFYAQFTNPSINFDRETRGIEATITAQPARNWRLQAGYNHNEGKEGRAAYLAYRYNDEFRVNAAGQVTLQDGTPLRVPVGTGAPIAPDGRTYAATVTTQILTTTMLRNGDASGNYHANLDASNGRILNAAAVGLSIPGVGTGHVGLPISQHQLGFVPPNGDQFLERRGGDPSPGYPRDAFTMTSMYSFSQGWLRGFGVGINATLNFDTLLYFYTDTAGGNVRRKLVAPDKRVFNLIASYQRKIGRRFTWKSQVNVNNVFDDRDLTFYPNVTTGVIDNAVLRTDGRKVIWTNTLSF